MSRIIHRSLVAFGAALALACGDEAPPPLRDPGEPSPRATEPLPEARPAVVFLGTSLTAGLGLEPDDAYPALIQRRIDEAGLPFAAVNAGVSGETSAGALARMDWVLQRPVAVLVVETGANDGLRGIDPDALRRNLDAILERAREATPSPALVVIGMEAPPNLGARYTTAFRSVYEEVARQHDATLIPFLLDGVAGVPSLNQEDGIHPTAEGHRRMAELVWKELEPVLRERARAQAAVR
ncbi:MAG TPA: arylesterase [Gemmatimonadales bacterium]|nr:arylesterase [Gemmatimonadales bacterium]